MSHYNLQSKPTLPDVIPGEYISSSDAINDTPQSLHSGDVDLNQSEGPDQVADEATVGTLPVDYISTSADNGHHSNDVTSYIECPNEDANQSPNPLNMDDIFSLYGNKYYISPSIKPESLNDAETQSENLYEPPNFENNSNTADEMNDNISYKADRDNELTTKQLSTIGLAVVGMTPEQASTYHKWNKNTQVQNDTSNNNDTSKENKLEGSSRNKGKEPDLQNYGLIGILPEELNERAQASEFRKYKKKDSLHQKGDDKCHHSISVPLSEAMERKIEKTVKDSQKPRVTGE
jgi:hypothetical protein